MAALTDFTIMATFGSARERRLEMLQSLRSDSQTFSICFAFWYSILTKAKIVTLEKEALRF